MYLKVVSYQKMNSSSREGRVLNKYFGDLCRAISDPTRLAEDLSAEGIIPSELSEELKVLEKKNGRESPSAKRQQAAVKMLSAVDQAVAKDASKMTILIQVLKDFLNDNGRAAEAVRTFEIDYRGSNEDFVSIQHARKVIMKHMNNIAAVITDAGRIADELYVKGIINEKSLEDVKCTLPEGRNSNDRAAMESVSKLLKAIELQVALDPGKFPVLIALLKDDPSTAQDVVAILEAEYCE